ncbi:hypothetical protein GQ607_013155 [Colletotrichum asianum]|uniref:Uncharacterized protein n=1 Tax=Colletotrichum asianum TaxID=702518 RepID=A0A8H3ZQ43_9PEZI|nr:hypothetical protein GQ607_013155 [Colletotrichum asianum]
MPELGAHVDCAPPAVELPCGFTIWRRQISATGHHHTTDLEPLRDGTATDNHSPNSRGVRENATASTRLMKIATLERDCQSKMARWRLGSSAGDSFSLADGQASPEGIWRRRQPQMERHTRATPLKHSNTSQSPKLGFGANWVQVEFATELSRTAQLCTLKDTSSRSDSSTCTSAA